MLVRATVELLVDGQQAREFFDGSRMILDPQIDVTVVRSIVATLVANHEEGRRLPSAFVPTGGLPGGQGSHQPVRQLGTLDRSSFAISARHFGDHRLPGQQVALHAELFSFDVSRPPVASFAGERCHPAFCVDDAHLPEPAVRVFPGQLVQGGLCRMAVRQQLESVGAVTDVGVRLGGNGADARLCPGNHRADAEELALDRHAEIPGRRVEADHGKRGDQRGLVWLG